MPDDVRWPSASAGKPNMRASQAITSTSIALVAGPPSSAWLFALTCMRGRVGGDRHRVRRLEHLPGVARVMERIVAPHPLDELAPRRLEPLRVRRQRGVRRRRLAPAGHGLSGTVEVVHATELKGARPRYPSRRRGTLVVGSMRFRSDDHLVRLFREGREDAFDAIHERHARRLQAVAARTRVADPEGVVQEAFLRAHRTLRDDRRHIELKPWLHRVVRNICIDELRKQRATVEYIDDGASEDIYSTLSRRHELRGADRGPRRPARAAARGAADARARRAQPRRGGRGARDHAAGQPPAGQARPHRARPPRPRRATPTARTSATTCSPPTTRSAARPSTRSATSRRCSGCREFRAQLKSTRTRLRALIPPVGLGPLAGVLGGAATGGTKLVAAGACCAVLAAGGATAWVAGQKEVVRDTSPGVEAGGRTLIDKPIRPGTKLPRTVAIANVTVALGRHAPARRDHLPGRHDRAAGSRNRAPKPARPRSARSACTSSPARTSTGSAIAGPRGSTSPARRAGPVVSIGLICKRR